MLTHCAFYHHHSIAGHGLASLHEAFACDDLVFDAYKLRPAILSAIMSNIMMSPSLSTQKTFRDE